MASEWGVSRDPGSQLSYDALPEQRKALVDAIVTDLVDLIARHPGNVINQKYYSFYRNPEPFVEVTYAVDHVNRTYVVKHFKAPLKPPVTGFVSYSHSDGDFLEEFRQHVTMLQANGYLAIWSDQDIEANDEWRKEIRDAIERAGIAVLLVTPGFISSQFIRYDELPLILLKRRDGRMEVFWIPVTDCDLAGTGLEGIQALCDAGTPLSRMHKSRRSTMLKEIVQTLRSKIERGTPGT
jgi:hypothetical protein